jgi:hypothetical protein
VGRGPCKELATLKRGQALLYSLQYPILSEWIALAGDPFALVLTLALKTC